MDIHLHSIDNMDKSGIYIIVNTLNSHFYVGSTNNFRVRKTKHESGLRNKYHHCKYLQNSFNKHSESNFIFVIVKIIDDIELLKKEEQLFLNVHFGKNYCYNSLPCCYGNSKKLFPKILLKSIYGRKRSAATKQKISLSHKLAKKNYIPRKNRLHDERLLNAKFSFLKDEIPKDIEYNILLEKDYIISEGRDVYYSWPRYFGSDIEKKDKRLEQRRKYKKWLQDQDLWYDKRSDSWERKSEIDKQNAIEILTQRIESQRLKLTDEERIEHEVNLRSLRRKRKKEKFLLLPIEEQQILLNEEREKSKQRRLNKTPEERKNNNKKLKEKRKAKLESMTQEELIEQKRLISEKYRIKKINETPEQREKRLAIKRKSKIKMRLKKKLMKSA